MQSPKGRGLSAKWNEDEEETGFMSLNKWSPIRKRLMLSHCSSFHIKEGLIRPELFGLEDEFLQLNVYDWECCHGKQTD